MERQTQSLQSGRRRRLSSERLVRWQKCWPILTWSGGIDCTAVSAWERDGADCFQPLPLIDEERKTERKKAPFVTAHIQLLGRHSSRNHETDSGCVCLCFLRRGKETNFSARRRRALPFRQHGRLSQNEFLCLKTRTMMRKKSESLTQKLKHLLHEEKWKWDNVCLHVQSVHLFFSKTKLYLFWPEIDGGLRLQISSQLWLDKPEHRRALLSWDTKVRIRHVINQVF